MTSLVKTLGQDPDSVMRQLPSRQLGWASLSAVTAGVMTWFFPAIGPEIILAVAMGVGVAAVYRGGHWWSAPVAAASVAFAGLAVHVVQWPVVLGAGLLAGAMTVWMMPVAMQWFDYLHSALATMSGAAFGLWLAVDLIPATSDPTVQAAVSAAIVALAAAQGMILPSWFADNPRAPSDKEVRHRLPPAYSAPVVEAWTLYRGASKRSPDVATRRGLHEVASWVQELCDARQDLDEEINAIDTDAIAGRIESHEILNSTDPFTRERGAATVTHLRRLLGHRQTLTIESQRAGALVSYAVAFLEEARAGLAIGRHLPGEAAPARLHEVLGRLRAHSAAGTARRQTEREMVALDPVRF